MTRPEAEKILADVGCIDPKNLGACHVTLCHWIDRHGRGETPWKNVDEAYQRLRQIDPPAVTQAGLFETAPTVND
jgi:hypothetical protein